MNFCVRPYHFLRTMAQSLFDETKDPRTDKKVSV